MPLGDCRRPDYTHLLSLIKAPTLIIVGIEDTMTPLELAQQMDQAIANSRLAYIRGAAHATSIERPEQFNRAVSTWVSNQMEIKNIDVTKMDMSMAN